jgi:hypothetical protein
MLKLGIFVADEDNLRVLKKNVAIVTKLYVTMPLVFVGFVCNLLIVVVLGRDKSMNKTTKFLLQMLALADIIYYVLRQIADIVEEQLLYSFSLRHCLYPRASQSADYILDGCYCNLSTVRCRQQTASRASVHHNVTDSSCSRRRLDRFIYHYSTAKLRLLS